MTSTASTLAVTARPAAWQDIITLTKPKIAAMSGIVAAGSMALVAMANPSLVVELGWGGLFAKGGVAIIGIMLSCMGAGALNMVLERDTDGLMERTKDRPLVQGRLSVGTGVGVGASLSAMGILILAVFSGPAPAALSALALFIYVLVYTPMKRTSGWSLIVGSVPGAMPALMGTTAIVGTMERTGLMVFLLMFVWQIPHFTAISIYREREYTAAGNVVPSHVFGIENAKLLVLMTTMLVVVLGALFWPLQIAGAIYGVVALVVGAWFIWLCASGFEGKTVAQLRQSRGRAVEDAWARRVFFGSLVYQTVIFAALGLDAVIYGLFR